MRFPALSAALGGAILLVTGCGIFGSNYSYRYRITVEVETPAGLKTGSAVHETLVSKSNVNLGDLSGKRGMRTRGEGVAIDLPDGQTLFALMPESSLTQAVLDPEWKNDWVDSANRISGGDTPEGPLPMTPGKQTDRFAKPIGYPLLVRFRDIADPKTVEEVNPANLAASFGPGVRLRRITLQVTDDDVTVEIEERFQWWNEYIDKFLNGSPTVMEDLRDKNIAAHLTSRSFSSVI